MFDPFMYLSLPLPSTSMRSMTVTVIKNGSDIQISAFTITVPKDGKLEDLIRALSTACSLDADETLLVAEVKCTISSDEKWLWISSCCFIFS